MPTPLPRPARPVELTDAARRKLNLVSTATLTSQLVLRGFRNTFLTGLAPLRADQRLLGYAFTLRYAPGREDKGGVAYDNRTDVQRLAVESIEEDDVLVIDARNETRAASLGHILATRISQRGGAGIVTDGALRDSPEFTTLPLPSYARAPHATTAAVVHHPVDANVTIGCAGVLVEPGDVLVGDAEGVVVLPAHCAESVAHDAYEQEVLERWILARVKRGTPIVDLYPPSVEVRADYDAWRAGFGEFVDQEAPLS